MKKIVLMITMLLAIVMVAFNGEVYAAGETITIGDSTTEPATSLDSDVYNLAGFGDVAKLYLISKTETSAEFVIYVCSCMDDFSTLTLKSGATTLDTDSSVAEDSTYHDVSLSGLTAGTSYTLELYVDMTAEYDGTATVTFTTDAEPFTVTYDSNGGSAVSPEDVEDGELATEPSDPTRAGYEFDGWHSDEALLTDWDFTTDTVTADTTLYAAWLDIYTVTFDTGDGSAVDSQEVTEGELATEPADPTLEGYEFVDWYSDEALTDPWDFTSDVITAPTTIYAGWEQLGVFYDTPTGGLIDLLPVLYIIMVIGGLATFLYLGSGDLTSKIWQAILIIVIGLSLLPIVYQIADNLTAGVVFITRFFP